MVHELSSPQAALIRSEPTHVDRYLSYVPKIVRLAGTVTSYSVDSRNGNVYEVTIGTTTGDADDVYPGAAVWIGTSVGGHERSILRVRDNLQHVGSTYVIPVGEIAKGAARIQIGDKVSLVDTRKPSPKIPRLLPIYDASGTPVNFTEFHDYDRAYTNQNIHKPPIANVTSDLFTPVQYAGWLNVEGGRDVLLSSITSVGIGDGIVSRMWMLDGASFQIGNSSSIGCLARFTEGFHWCALIVSTAYTSSIHWFPIWAHGPSYPPITNFNITEDEREEWRHQMLEIFDSPGLSDELIPGSTLCSWEVVTYNGAPPPWQRPTQTLGWSPRDIVQVEGFEDTWQLELVGIAGWLMSFEGFGQFLEKPDTGEVNEWHEALPGTLKVDHVVAYVLREYSNALELSNLYLLSSNNDIILEEEIKLAKQWEQIKYLVSGYLGKCASDSGGAIWIGLQPNYGDHDAIDAWPTIITIDQTDWIYQPGFSITAEIEPSVSSLTMAGSYYDGNKSHELASVGPGDAPLAVGDRVEGPYQRLPNPTAEIAQSVLNARSGAEWKRRSPAYQPFTLEMISDIDVFEPSWNEIVRVSMQVANAAGYTWVSVPCSITSVSIGHSYAAGDPQRVVRVTFEVVEKSEPGTTVLVPDSPVPAFEILPAQPTMIPLAEFVPLDGLYPNLQTAVAFPRGGTTIYRTGPEFNNSGLDVPVPVWDPLDLLDVDTVQGEIEDFAADQASPHYLDTGSEINGWLLTTTHVYRVEDVGADPIISFEYALPDGGDPTTMRRSIRENPGVLGEVVVVGIDLDDDSVVYISRSLDNGATWADHTVDTIPAIDDLCLFPISLFRLITNTDTHARSGQTTGAWVQPYDDSGGSFFDSSVPGYTGTADALGQYSVVAWSVNPPPGTKWTEVTSSVAHWKYALKPGFSNAHCQDFYFASRVQFEDLSFSAWVEDTDIGNDHYAPDVLYSHTFPNAETGKIIAIWFQIAIHQTCDPFSLALNIITVTGNQNVYGVWATGDGGANAYGPKKLNHYPGVWLAPGDADIIVTSWPRHLSGFLAAALAASTDGGATLADVNGVEWPFIMAGAIMVAPADQAQTRFYHGASVCSDDASTAVGFMRSDAASTSTNISPTMDATPFGLTDEHAHPISISQEDKRTVLLTGAQRDISGAVIAYGVFLTTDEGLTYSVLLPPSIDLNVRSVAITRDQLHWFGWGAHGFVGVSTDTGTALVDKTGNMPDVLIVKIVGG